MPSASEPVASKLCGGAAPTKPKLAEEEDEEETTKQTDKQKKKKKKQKERKRAKSKSKDRDDEEKQMEVRRGRTASGKKIPAGGVSIFGGAAKSKESAGLFAEDDEDDLNSGKAAASGVKAPSKQDVKKPSLFDDDDDDDDFTSTVKSKPKPAETKKPSKKKLPTCAVSKFGPCAANLLAAALNEQRPQSVEEDDNWSDGNKSRSGSLKSNKSRIESIKSKKSTASKSSTSSKRKSNRTKKPPDCAASMFPGGTNPFGAKKRSEPELKKMDTTTSITKVTKPKATKLASGASLFGEDGEEPRTPRKQTREDDEVEESKPKHKKPVGGVSMFGPGTGAQKEEAKPAVTVATLRSILAEAVKMDQMAPKSLYTEDKRPKWWPLHIPFQKPNGLKRKDLEEVLKESCKNNQTKNEEKVNTSMTVDQLRKTISRTLNSGCTMHYIEKNKPAWWPTNVPFIKPSYLKRPELIEVVKSIKVEDP